MANFIAYLSDGRVLNSKDYNYPGQKTPWMVIVDLLNDQNLYLLRKHYGELDNEKLKELYKQDLHAFKSSDDITSLPNLIRVVNLQLEVNGIVYNSASTSRRSRFPIDYDVTLNDYQAYSQVGKFWIFNRLDWVIQEGQKQDRFISFSFVVNNTYRIFQWVDTTTNESYIEVCGLDDKRNLRVEKELIG
jgi:hypothetical protein